MSRIEGNPNAPEGGAYIVYRNAENTPCFMFFRFSDGQPAEDYMRALTEAGLKFKVRTVRATA